MVVLWLVGIAPITHKSVFFLFAYISFCFIHTDFEGSQRPNQLINTHGIKVFNFLDDSDIDAELFR